MNAMTVVSRARGCLPFILVGGVAFLSLFFGFVGAAVLGAVAPGTVAFAADMACDGTVDHSTYSYSYRPGQRGTSQVWTCTSASGEETQIVGKTYVYASLVFSAGSAVVLGLLATGAGAFMRRVWPQVHRPR